VAERDRKPKNSIIVAAEQELRGIFLSEQKENHFLRTEAYCLAVL
jgi:hypothetical protein